MDSFYSSPENLNKKIKLLKEAKKRCTHWWFDEVKEGSFRRTPVKISFEKALELLTDKCLFTVIERQKESIGYENYGEIGFCTKNSKYMWVIVSLEDFNSLVKEFDLEYRDMA